MTTISMQHMTKNRRPNAKRSLRRVGFILVNVLLVASALFPFYWILTTSVKTTNS